VLPARGWFASAPPEFQRALLAIARTRTLPAGSPLYHADSGGRDVFGVLAGVVSVSSRFSAIDAPFIHLFRAGDWSGMGPLFGARSRRASVVARTDVRLARVPADELEELLRRRPEWWPVLGSGVLEYGDISAQAAADMLIRDTQRRCAAGLLRLAGLRWAAHSEIESHAEVPLSKAELAGSCNVSRTILNQVLRSLAQRGAVESGYRSVVVVAPAVLRALVDEP
jgi:CRP-like cAMP-binding protein